MSQPVTAGSQLDSFGGRSSCRSTRPPHAAVALPAASFASVRSLRSPAAVRMADICAADGLEGRLGDVGATARLRSPGPSRLGLGLGSLRARRRAHAAVPAALDKSAAGSRGAAGVLSSPLDGDICALLVPAIVAVFLDPAMALIDTGAAGTAVQRACLHLLWVSVERGGCRRGPRQFGQHMGFVCL